MRSTWHTRVNFIFRLEFTVQFRLVGDNRARSDVAGATLKLAGVTINTAPFGVGVSFVCEYPMIANVESSPFSVTKVTVSGSKSGDGDLSGGFSMALNDGADTPLVLGSNLKVQVDWSISSLTGQIQCSFNLLLYPLIEKMHPRERKR